MSTETLISIEGGVEAVFRSRPNRFLCNVIPAGGGELQAHVADPGRLRELLFPGNRVLVRRVKGKNRKTGYSLLAADRAGDWVLVNTMYHRRIAEALLGSPQASPFPPVRNLQAEKSPDGFASRFDFLVTLEDETRVWLEVKGCTLAMDGVALFPDAPTARGRKHLEELTRLKESGEEAMVMFLVFAGGVDRLEANGDTDPGFAAALRDAVDAGVGAAAVRLAFDGRDVLHRGEIPVCV
jgi:sugar fermentation stimulation protein A